MAQVCRQCSRINPADAAYCYHDGVPLGRHDGSGPIQAGAQTFPSQFVFPSGQVCKNFDQLALACHENWSAAVEMLKQGYLGAFFGGLGRADLAAAAIEAAQFPDSDRGLDQLLAKLPTSALQAPKLKAEPSVINLGQIKIGDDRHTELHLQNLGMRLCYGTVSSDARWLTLGEPPGSEHKIFQFGGETTIPINIRGQHLRAGAKPLEGHLVVESSGGTATVTLRADVSVTPFDQDGIFQGAVTPRQIAEKAKLDPKAAAPYFESGAVAQWFTRNGWIYPVQGPTVSGVGGVQQFFEALGLARAPKVEINKERLELQGDGGAALQTTIEVSTQERKVVYAHAVCDQPWVACTKVKLLGRRAKLTIAVPRVPNRPGETLQAKVTVYGNGSQKFVVPLALTVGAADPNPLAAPVTASSSAAPSAASSAAPLPPLIDDASPFVFSDAPLADSPFAFVNAPEPAAPLAPPAAVVSAPTPEAVALLPRGPAAPPTAATGAAARFWLHAAPLAALVVALVSVLLFDLFQGGAADPEDDVDPTQRLGLYFDYADSPERGIGNTMKFGLAMLDPAERASVVKYLTYHLRGHTNSALVRIDGQDREFGKLDAGKFDRPRPSGRYGGRKVEFVFSQDQIVVTQVVEIVPGEVIEVSPEVYRRVLDTCLVRYVLRNRDDRAHEVGFRFVLDTLIGGNDGTPFTIPGSTKLVSTSEDFDPARNKKPIPDFLQALENENLRAPGTVAQVNFRLGERIEPPGRVSLTQWPGFEALKRYEITVRNFEHDSALVMYWPPKELAPGKSREIGFGYGLGDLSAQTAKIGLTVGGSFVAGGELTVVALIAEPEKGQSVTLELPAGLTLLDNYPATQKVPPATEKLPDGRLRASPVTWRLRAESTGAYPVLVRTSDGLEAARQIVIRKSSIF